MFAITKLSEKHISEKYDCSDLWTTVANVTIIIINV